MAFPSLPPSVTQRAFWISASVLSTLMPPCCCCLCSCLYLCAKYRRLIYPTPISTPLFRVSLYFRVYKLPFPHSLEVRRAHVAQSGPWNGNQSWLGISGMLLLSWNKHWHFLLPILSSFLLPEMVAEPARCATSFLWLWEQWQENCRVLGSTILSYWTNVCSYQLLDFSW